MLDPSQVDPLTMALLAQRSGGQNVRNVAIGGGPMLMSPQQQQSMLMARALMGQDPGSARTKGEGLARLGQQVLGAFMFNKASNDMEAQQQGDAKTMADALKAWTGRPAETKTYTDQTTGDPTTINWNAVPGNKSAALGMLAANPRLAPQALAMQAQDDAIKQQLALKQQTTLSPEEVAKMGLPAGSVVQRDAFGGLNVVNKPDDTWISPAGGAPLNPNAPAAQPQGGTQTVPRPDAPIAQGGPVAAPLRPTIAKTAEELGFDPATALTVAHIESGMGTRPDRDGSQYKGVYQLSPQAYQQYQSDPTNKDHQVRAGIRMLGDTQAALTNVLGRAPEPWEVYLAHQQGVAGASALLNADPKLRAADAIAPYYKGGANEQAIVGNLPKGMGKGTDTTAGEFASIWRDRYNNVARLYGQAGRTQVADAGTVATDAMPAGAPGPAQAAGGQWQQFVNKKTGEILERNAATGAFRPFQKPPEPTDLAKLRAERDALPDGSPDRAVYDAEIAKKGSGAKPPGFDVESDLRDKFQAQQPVKNFREVVPIFQSLKDAIGRDNAAADLNIVYGVAKIMDPASVVREGETAMAVKTGSPAERLIGLFNYVAEGGRLTEKQRAQLLTEAQSRFTGHQDAYSQIRDQYMDLGRQYGVDPKRSIIDIRLPEPPQGGGAPEAPGGQPGVAQAAQPPAAQPARITNDEAGLAAFNDLPSGALFIDPEGKTRRKP